MFWGWTNGMILVVTLRSSLIFFFFFVYFSWIFFPFFDYSLDARDWAVRKCKICSLGNKHSDTQRVLVNGSSAVQPRADSSSSLNAPVF